MLNRRIFLRLLPCLMLAAASCTRAAQNENGELPVSPALIHFSNQSLDQADVFAVVSGLDARRIGTVFPGRTETLRVPNDITSRSGSVTIVARLLARSYVASTGSVALYPGEEYQIILPSNTATLTFLPARTQ